MCILGMFKMKEIFETGEKHILLYLVSNNRIERFKKADLVVKL